MAVCKRCYKEMMDPTTVSCDECPVEFPDGTLLPQSTFPFNEPDRRCPDCNIVNGRFHHLNCDMERCPRCLGQLISCGCFD
jgi:hypothetical protein